MKNLIYLVQNKIYPRDLNVDRYAINKFSRMTNVTIIDLSYLFYKLKNTYNYNFKNITYYRVKNLNFFKNFFFDKSLILDFLPHSRVSFKIRNILKNNNIIIKRSNLYPTNSNYLSVLVNYLRVLFKSNFFRFDYFIATGKESFKDLFFFTSKKIIYGNSYDYDRVLKKNFKFKNNSFAIYLDEGLIGHPDYKILGINQGFIKKTFYKRMNIFFKKVEANIKIPIYVAKHPKMRTKDYRNLFPNRKIIVDNTKEAVKNAKYVFAHSSTSINYAVLFKKLILILSSSELSKSYIFKYMMLFSKNLNCKIYNIDNKKSAELDSLFYYLRETGIDKCKYKQFESNYIQHPKSHLKNSWDFLSKIPG